MNRISAIQFSGNHITKERVLLQELTIKVGDPVDREQLEKSRQSIMDLGLFKSVHVNISESGVVVFTMKEKRYVLLLPRFSRDSENDKITPGARLTISNIAGLNQRLSLTYIQRDAEDENDGKEDELGAEFYYPKVAGSNYNLITAINFRQGPVRLLQAGVPVSKFEKDDLNISLLVSRWWRKTAPSSGWLLGAGFHFAKRDYQYVSGLSNGFVDDNAMSLLGQIAYTDVHDHRYSRSGVQYGYNLEQGLEFLGSDYQFSRHLLYYRRFILLDRAHHNLNVQARLGFSDGHLSNLEEDAFSIDGYGDLRGYENEVSGDAFAILNLEYLRPLLDWKQVRGLLFVDVGNAYASNSDVDLSGLKWAGGLGVRWKLQSFVSLDLSLEYAYNFDEKSYKVYFGTKKAF